MSRATIRTTRDWKERARSNVTNILRLAIVLLFLGLAIWAITLNHYGLVIANHEPWLWLTVALVSVGPELAGIVIGVVTIDYLNERRQREQLKAQLIRQMGMNVRDVAVTAALELTHHNWAHDGSLSGAYLGGADLRMAHLEAAILSGANLEGANLSGAYLDKADLSGAYLRHIDMTIANLAGADLSRANLDGADLGGADLGGAVLEEADLRYSSLVLADLGGAMMRGAILYQANLTKANLRLAHLSQAELSHAMLIGTNLSTAFLTDVFLLGANLYEAHLSGAYLKGADLTGVKNWTISQLAQAAVLEGATMPDGTKLLLRGADQQENAEGPTFEAWKTQYLAKHGGIPDTVRDIWVQGDTPTGDPESLPPWPS